MINKDQNFWNFIFTVLFIGFLVLLAYSLGVGERIVPTSIPFFDFLLLVLASFRVIRLFIYDKITQFIRDWFIQAERGPLKTISELLACPWCFGIWAAAVITYFYFLSPVAWFFILIMAVAGLASMVQLLGNLIGWRAESSKIEAQSKGSLEKSAGTCGVK